MFTGIVEATGSITKIKPAGNNIRLSIKPSAASFLKGMKKGESVSVNGACMTAERISGKQFSITVVKESLSKTNLGDLRLKSKVNLEKAMKLNSRLDGHLVQGHVDTTGIVSDVNLGRNGGEFRIVFPVEYYSNIIYVGSIAINGVSLTVAGIENPKKGPVEIKVAIIPHTIKHTNFSALKLNDRVNIEFDMIGKYLKRILEEDKLASRR